MDEPEQTRIFDAWINQHRGLVFKVVGAHAFTPHDREDLFQEIITQIWNSVPNFRGESAVTTWLYRVSLNSAMAWSRRERRHRGRTEPLDGTEPAILEPARAPDRRLAWLYEEIAKLDFVDRSLALLLLDGQSYREIADTLGISESNVGVKLHRIKNELINKAKEHESHES